MRLLAALALLLLAAAVQAQGTQHVTALRAGIAADSLHLAEGNASAAMGTLPYRVAVADSLDDALAELESFVVALADANAALTTENAALTAEVAGYAEEVAALEADVAAAETRGYGRARAELAAAVLAFLDRLRDRAAAQ